MMSRMRLFWAVPIVVLIAAPSLYFGLRHQDQYAWLVFGPHARIRVLACINGKSVSLTRYADGKPVGQTTSFRDLNDCHDVPIAGEQEKTTYLITSFSDSDQGGVRRFMISVAIKGPAPYYQYADIGPDADQAKAAIAHFDGPLTVEVRTIMWKLPPDLALKRGPKPTDLCACIGTFSEEKGCWVVVYTQRSNGKSFFPPGVHPFADVEFPPKAPGGKVIRRRYPLDQFC